MIAPGQAISLAHVTVKPDRVVCLVDVARPHRSTDPWLMERVVKRFPDIPYHACVNQRGTQFASIMNNTPLPHLLEHVVIQLQTEATLDNAAVFTGTTEWEDEPAGRACVQVSFYDDLVALRAFSEAVEYLNRVIAG